MSDKFRLLRAFAMMIIVAIVLFFIISLTFVHATPAPAPKYDGQWTINATNNCKQPPSDIIIIIKGDKLQAAEIMLDISGKVSDNGQVNMVMTHNGKTLNVVGHLSGNAGNGTWQTDNCSGSWKAVRNGK